MSNWMNRVAVAVAAGLLGAGRAAHNGGAATADKASPVKASAVKDCGDACCDAPARGTPVVKAAEMGAEVKEAVAVMRPTGVGPKELKGLVKFTDTGKGVKVTATFEGLPASAELGFHVHEFGDLTGEDGMTTGGHYNPDGHQHGAPGEKAHAGDMGNVKTGADGKATHEVTIPHATLSGKNALLGRAVIIHGKTDDLKSQPAGNAGPRIGSGVVGVAQVKK